MVEAMEIVEMYCDLVLARFGLITQMKELDEGLGEAISSLIWVAPRMHTDVQVIWPLICIYYLFIFYYFTHSVVKKSHRVKLCCDVYASFCIFFA